MVFHSYGIICGQNSCSLFLSRTEEVSRTTQIQPEAGILWIVWLFEGVDVTSNSEFQQPTPRRPSVQGGAHPAAN